MIFQITSRNFFPSTILYISQSSGTALRSPIIEYLKPYRKHKTRMSAKFTGLCLAMHPSSDMHIMDIPFFCTNLVLMTSPNPSSSMSGIFIITQSPSPQILISKSRNIAQRFCNSLMFPIMLPSPSSDGQSPRRFPPALAGLCTSLSPAPTLPSLWPLPSHGRPRRSSHS